MNTANKITMLRIVLVPIFMVILLSKLPFANYIALGVFVIASITDILDGYIARKYNQITNFGKFIDPLADKLLVIAALLVFTVNGSVALWVTMVIITREFVVTSLRIVAISEGIIIAASLWGKIKTITQVSAIIGVMLFENLLHIPFFMYLRDILVYISAIATIYSGIEYIIVNRNVIGSDI